MVRILSLVIGLVPVSAVRADHPAYPGHAQVLRLASEGDVSGIARIRREHLGRASAAERFVIYLASRMVEPSRFTDEFVSAFPERREDWPHLDYAHVDELFRNHGPPEIYIPGELASIAEQGHREAIRKMIAVARWAGGAGAEMYLTGVVRCLMAVPEATLLELEQVRPGARSEVLEGAFALELLDDDAPKLLTAIRGAASSAPELVREIERLVSEELATRSRSKVVRFRAGDWIVIRGRLAGFPEWRHYRRIIDLQPVGPSPALRLLGLPAVEVIGQAPWEVEQQLGQLYRVASDGREMPTIMIDLVRSEESIEAAARAAQLTFDEVLAGRLPELGPAPPGSPAPSGSIPDLQQVLRARDLVWRTRPALCE